MHKKIIFLIYLGFLTGLSETYCQKIVGERTFTSPIAGVNGATVEDMVILNVETLFSLDHSGHIGDWGIIADIGGVGMVSLKVFLYDAQSSNHKGTLLYGCKTTITTNSFGGTSSSNSLPGFPFGLVLTSVKLSMN